MGMGHVKKRGKTWSYIVDVYDSSGKRKQKWVSGFATEKEAKKALAQKLVEINAGTYIEPNKESIKDFMEWWMTSKKSKLRPGTVRAYNWLINTHIIPGIGHIQLSKLKPQQLESFYDQLLDNGLAPRSIKAAHNIIHSMLKKAQTFEIVSRNVAQLVETPKTSKPKMNVWEADHVMRFLETASQSRNYIVYVLALTTGMRMGELLALRWKNVNYNGDKANISVTETFSKSDHGYEFQDPKTKTSNRLIALPKDVTELLKAHRKEQLKEKLKNGHLYEDQDLIIATKIGTPVYPRNLSRQWYNLLEKANVPAIRFHDLRHTHATLMLKQGIHVKIVSERLGHSNISVTLDTYSHVLPHMQEEAADAIGSLLFDKKSSKRAEAE